MEKDQFDMKELAKAFKVITEDKYRPYLIKVPMEHYEWLEKNGFVVHGEIEKDL